MSRATIGVCSRFSLGRVCDEEEEIPLGQRIQYTRPVLEPDPEEETKPKPIYPIDECVFSDSAPRSTSHPQMLSSIVDTGVRRTFFKRNTPSKSSVARNQNAAVLGVRTTSKCFPIDFYLRPFHFIGRPAEFA